ncbi:MAG: metalloregulator ArsR/SmtB family transcription factor [Oscillochloridaceae bacterium umkhey_bin13]
MNEQPLDATVQYLKALAHASRLRILGILADGEYSVGDLADLLELKESTISHHLAILQAVDLVAMTPYGTSHLYHLNEAALDRLSRDLLRPAIASSPAPSLATPDAWAQKVLTTFVKDGQFVKIPEQRKKRRVILDWLCVQITPEQRYHERDLNTLLRQFHADTATLRRELVAEGLLRREGDWYWRELA